MKKFNCPDCHMVDTNEINLCANCFRNNNNPFDIVRYGSDWSSKDDPCKHCSNHPSNGGSGICYCTIGYKFKVTY